MVRQQHMKTRPRKCNPISKSYCVVRSPQKIDFNWTTLWLRRHDLSSLDVPIFEHGIKRSIDLLPSNKDPGPDCFTRLFFKTCWNIIKGDVLEATNVFHALHCGSLSLINTDNVIVFPKKEGVEEVGGL